MPVLRHWNDCFKTLKTFFFFDRQLSPEQEVNDVMNEVKDEVLVKFVDALDLQTWMKLLKPGLGLNLPAELVWTDVDHSTARHGSGRSFLQVFHFEHHRHL